MKHSLEEVCFQFHMRKYTGAISVRYWKTWFLLVTSISRLKQFSTMKQKYQIFCCNIIFNYYEIPVRQLLKICLKPKNLICLLYTNFLFPILRTQMYISNYLIAFKGTGQEIKKLFIYRTFLRGLDHYEVITFRNNELNSHLLPFKFYLREIKCMNFDSERRLRRRLSANEESNRGRNTFSRETASLDVF